MYNLSLVHTFLCSLMSTYPGYLLVHQKNLASMCFISNHELLSAIIAISFTSKTATRKSNRKQNSTLCKC